MAPLSSSLAVWKRTLNVAKAAKEIEASSLPGPCSGTNAARADKVLVKLYI